VPGCTRASRRRSRGLVALVAASWASAAAWASVPLAQEASDEGAVPESRLEDLLEGGSGSQRATRRYAEEDFAPYFAAGTLAQAKGLFDRRRYARARALLRGDAPPVRYLRALAVLELDPAAAAAELRALAADYPPLRDHCLFHAARALERLRKRSAAAAAYGEVSAGSALHAEARLARSRVLERALDLDGALEALAAVRELPVIPANDAVRRRALLAAARLCQKRLDYAGEHRAMLELWATSPLSREAAAVWERLKELPIPNRWRLRRAESFLSFHDNLEAIRLARQVKTSLPDEHACRAAFVEGNALRKERQHRRAIATLAPMAEACRASELRPQALYVLGYSQSIVAPEDAIRTYDALAGDHPDHPFADDALFFAAELDARAGRATAALQRLETVASRHAEGNFAPEALFRIAWLRREAGAPKPALDALERLDQLAGLGRGPLLRARYWRARILAEVGDASAPARFAALAARYPATWYGLLARARVGADGEVAAARSCPGDSSCAGAPPWPLEAGPLGANPHFLAAVELLRMELPGAGAELLAVDRRGLPDDAARLLMEALRRTGRRKAAAYVARTTLGSGLTGGLEATTAEVWRATYPRPFRKTVERWARASGVDPDLLQALIREESLFDRWARSSAGAIGLAQLMPATARGVARRLKLGRISPEALHRSDLNVRLGAAYLSELLSQFDGSEARAVAAYNAGPEAVSRWIRARPDDPLDEWVERIPAAETRDYVKNVLGSYAAYRLVYGGIAAAIEEPHASVAARAGRGR
jgi:soluble lytic murein transglycosylase